MAGIGHSSALYDCKSAINKIYRVHKKLTPKLIVLKKLKENSRQHIWENADSKHLKHLCLC